MMITDDRISTREGTQLWGCCKDTLLAAMRRYHIRPEVRLVPNKHGGLHREYFWRPADVLRVRAEHKLWLVERPRKLKPPKKGTRRHARATAMAKVTLQEGQRLKILQRVAERQGITVEKLCVDKGLEAWYRSLPPKYKRTA